MIRKIIKIDEEKCNGCGLCVPGCAEEAIKIINGKAKLVSDVYCDGLGACIGDCPEGALSIEEREAEAFDEQAVQAAIEARRNHGRPALVSLTAVPAAGGVCPGTAHAVFDRQSQNRAAEPAVGSQPTELTHWPVQLHLINPAANFLQEQDVVLAADCVAYTMGDFHARFLRGKSLAIACPKLDSGLDEYLDKIRRMVDEAKINTLTLVIMQVPCCSGLLQIVQTALQKAARKVPLKVVVISTRGDVLSQEWV
ncbi:MAG TPA: 4Fe-4S binding protein [Smithellaceae bacterium]|jgi:Pyruvate/2-oxoacid:ferredoxin oxidoreductase delta subunit|nr:4Fe-4S binding protein [Smithellaceae bacterium]HQF84761.1 4Fe-4S binding protein [Smithellaceae bacterium]HQG81034.1 4Fe-4S binding protein [Smithellaceae bacterium]